MAQRSDMTSASDRPESADSSVTVGSAASQTGDGTPPKVIDQSETPRAFATTTGFLFQVIGLALLLGSALLWFIVSQWQDADAPIVMRWIDHFTSDRLPAALGVAGLIVGFVGGLALIAVGIGLQGERARSATPAMWLSGGMALVYGILAILLVGVGNGQWAVGCASGALTIVMVLLFLLSGHSASVLKQFPPPTDQNIVTDEWVEQYRRERRENRAWMPSADYWDGDEHVPGSPHSHE